MKTEITNRRRAREAALQMLYQCEVGRAGVHEAIATYWPAREDDERLDEPYEQFANDLVRGTIARVAEIDALLAKRAQNWRVERMAIVDRIVLRLAVYELLTDPDTPGKVVINEAIELARSYTGEDAVGFVNGILDSIRKDLGRE